MGLSPVDPKEASLRNNLVDWVGARKDRPRDRILPLEGDRPRRDNHRGQWLQ